MSKRVKGTGFCIECGEKIGTYAKRCKPCEQDSRRKNPDKYRAKSNSAIDKNIKPYMLTRYGSNGMNIRTGNSCMSGSEV